MMNPIQPIKGRGAPENPPNRFERLHVERDPDSEEPDGPAPATQFYFDRTKSLISTNDSPDLGFSASFNPYRGCEHGCVYCYARPGHEYLGLSAGLDFETKIFVKMEAPRLLREELSSRSWKPQVMMVSGVTDCYQPVERRLQLTRQCLEVLAEFRNPIGIVTKNELVTRDIDLLQELHRFQCVGVSVSLTTLREEIQQTMEPRTSIPKARLRAIETLAKAGIPVGMLVAPIIPGLTDYEIPAILQAGRNAGAAWAGYTLVRLPHGVGPLFEKWLEAHFPDAKEKVIGRIREVRGGKLNDPRFGSRMEGEGPYAKELSDLFQLVRRKAGYPEYVAPLSTANFKRGSGPQMEFF